MWKILANDGIDAAGLKILNLASVSVDTNRIAQEDLPGKLNDYDGILVRSATTVRKELIDACPNLKLIGRAGVGMDNIDVAYAREKGLAVINTPEASSQSVAELVIAHMYTLSRFLQQSNRDMPSSTSKERFAELKKVFSAGTELKGKTLGIIGFGNIGKCVARSGLALGMRILPYRRSGQSEIIHLDFHPAHQIPELKIHLEPSKLDHLLAESDFITLHTPLPKGAPPLLAEAEIKQMKKGVILINTARGGAIDENALLQYLDNGHIAGAGLDVFVGEPLVNEKIRNHPRVSLSPHIGGSTAEAQQRIGIEIAEKIVKYIQSNA